VTKESFGEAKTGNSNVNVEATSSKRNDMVLYESSNRTGLDRVCDAGGDKRVGEKEKEGVGDSSSVVATFLVDAPQKRKDKSPLVVQTTSG